MIEFTEEEKQILSEFLSSLPSSTLGQLALNVLPALIESGWTGTGMFAQYLSAKSAALQASIDGLQAIKDEQEASMTTKKELIDGLLLKIT